mgnify:CR=1 FL=1
MSINVLVVGSGAMAKEYLKVLQALNAPVTVVGRSASGAEAFERDTGLAVLSGGLEANLEALDPELTAAVAGSFERDFAQSQAVSLEAWKARPLWRRVKQRVWGWIDRLVVNLLDRRS